MPQVTPRRTPYSAESLSVVLDHAWRAKFSEPLPSRVLLLLLSLADFETGDGRPSVVSMPNCFHYNLGNIILPAQYIWDETGEEITKQRWFVLNGDEGEAAGAGNEEHHYKVYDSLQHGAAALVNLLTRKRRQKWWDGLLTGDPTAFVRALKGLNGGPAYFEASLDVYLPGFTRRFNKYVRFLSPVRAPGEAVPSVEKLWRASPWVSLPEIEKGSIGLPVAIAQLLHNAARPVVPLTVDGSYGPATESALKRLLKSERPLRIDGEQWHQLFNTPVPITAARLFALSKSQLVDIQQRLSEAGANMERWAGSGE